MRHGFTLLELLLAMSILGVVSMLSFVAIRSSHETVSLSDAKAEIQSNLRDTMQALTSELELAFAETEIPDDPEAPEDVEPIRVSPDAKSVTFQRPVPADNAAGYVWSSPITFTFVNEDLPSETGEPNARLDGGEDVNGDGVLNRQIVRTEDGQSMVVGAANNLSDATFTLVDNIAAEDNRKTTLRIRLEASKRHGPGFKGFVRQEMEGQIHLIN